MCSASLKVCPVGGCTSIPLKYLEKHIANVHPSVSPEEAAQLLRTAAVFRVPSGKTRREAVVRRSKRLQLAKKRTGKSQSGTRREETAAPTHCSELEELHVVDKAIQCDLLPPGFLEALDKSSSCARCELERQTSSTTASSRRPQYAKKSSSSANLSLTTRHLATSQTDGCPALADDGERSPAISPPAGQPCEFMYKCGEWDVIFYETPSQPLPPPPNPSLPLPLPPNPSLHLPPTHNIPR